MKIKLSGFSFGLIVLLGILCGIANADSITLRDGHPFRVNLPEEHKVSLLFRWREQRNTTR